MEKPKFRKEALHDLSDEPPSTWEPDPERINAILAQWEKDNPQSKIISSFTIFTNTL